MGYQLSLLHNITATLDLRGILPECLNGLSLEEVADIEVWLGNRKQSLGQLFQIEATEPDSTIRFQGDLSKADFIGAEMTTGQIIVDGSVGNRAGQGLGGGAICILGNAGNNLAEAAGKGTIIVEGNAGDRVGCPTPGNSLGMNETTIWIHGNAGSELGHRMRRGILAVEGNCGDYAGYEMLAGTIIVGGKLGKHVGLAMRRGTIISCSDQKIPPSVGLAHGCQFQPPIMPLLSHALSEMGATSLGSKLLDRQFEQYHGDSLQLARGEVFIPSA